MSSAKPRAGRSASHNVGMAGRRLSHRSVKLTGRSGMPRSRGLWRNSPGGPGDSPPDRPGAVVPPSGETTGSCHVWPGTTDLGEQWRADGEIICLTRCGHLCPRGQMSARQWCPCDLVLLDTGGTPACRRLPGDTVQGLQCPRPRDDPDRLSSGNDDTRQARVDPAHVSSPRGRGGRHLLDGRVRRGRLAVPRTDVQGQMPAGRGPAVCQCGEWPPRGAAGTSRFFGKTPRPPPPLQNILRGGETGGREGGGTASVWLVWEHKTWATRVFLSRSRLAARARGR